MIIHPSPAGTLGWLMVGLSPDPPVVWRHTRCLCCILLRSQATRRYRDTSGRSVFRDGVAGLCLLNEQKSSYSKNNPGSAFKYFKGPFQDDVATEDGTCLCCQYQWESYVEIPDACRESPSQVQTMTLPLSLHISPLVPPHAPSFL